MNAQGSNAGPCEQGVNSQGSISLSQGSTSAQDGCLADKSVGGDNDDFKDDFDDFNDDDDIDDDIYEAMGDDDVDVDVESQVTTNVGTDPEDDAECKG